MKALEIILMSNLIGLVAFGFVHFIILDWLFHDKPAEYKIMKYWAGKVTIALTVLAFGSAVIMLTIILFQ